jgi:lactate dehydrogenase-like 2-hydroxyacid dehydrogenase
MKLVFLDAKTLGDIDLSKFNEFGEVKIYETTKKDEVLGRVKNADIVFTNKVVIDKEIMDKSNIKIIQIMATGMNNVDLEYAKKKGIIVKNVAGYSTNAVAQLTFAFVLEIMNKVRYFNDYVNNEYSSSDIFTHIINWNELNNKKWGIIGLGAIGKKVAEIATAFGCEVSYYSTSGKNNNSDYKKIELNSLLKNSDIISIHAPLNENTKNLLNKNNLNLIKKGAILLNLGRGGIVNEKDLSEIIDKNGFFAGFDVFSKEPIEKDNPLLKSKNILLTPHIAWASVEAREKLVKLAYENIKNLRGQI